MRELAGSMYHRTQ